MLKFLQLHFKLLSSFEPENSLESFLKSSKTASIFMLISTQNLIFYVTKVGLRSEMLIILTGSCCCGCFFSPHPNATRLDEKLNSNSNLNSFSRSSFLLFSFFDVFFLRKLLVYEVFISLFSRYWRRLEATFSERSQLRECW